MNFQGGGIKLGSESLNVTSFSYQRVQRYRRSATVALDRHFVTRFQEVFAAIEIWWNSKISKILYIRYVCM